MIEYYRGPYGANLLFRWHGSALAKSFVPGLVSVAIYLSLHFVYRFDEDVEEHSFLSNPYAIGVLVSSVSFLITFRANYGYQRYWEACTNVHQLMSKWMDATSFAGIFHMQSAHYDGMRPPSFHQYDELNALGLSRDREKISWPLMPSSGEDSNATHSYYRHGDSKINGARQVNITTRSSGIGSTEHDEERRRPQHSQVRDDHGHNNDAAGFSSDLALEVQNRTNDNSSDDKYASSSTTNKTKVSALRRRRYRKSINETKRTIRYRSEHGDEDELETIDETRLLGPPRLDGGWGLLYSYDNDRADASTDQNERFRDELPRTRAQQSLFDDEKGFASRPGGRTPSLFLQELTHLSSLLVAVALSTLRHDMEDAEPPLGVYVPGMKWPAADPQDLPLDVKRMAEGGIFGGVLRNLRYTLGMDQTSRSRTTYNAARPMLVLGGVSDNEIAYLMRARGPYARTQLVSSWLSDFMLRESMAGSMGDVAPPIISRLFQFMSDGMTFYSHALKITYIPFPFPHAQLSAFFVLVMVVVIPFLMDQYANHAWLGAMLTFLTVTCLAGLHEVARELETPFRSVPNDVPLCTLLAFYNETLITTFAGFHPDAYWKTKADTVLKNMKDKKDAGCSTSSTDAAAPAPAPAPAPADVEVDGHAADDEQPFVMPEMPIASNGAPNRCHLSGSSNEVSLSPHPLPVLSNNNGLSTPSILPRQAPIIDDDIDSMKQLKEAIESQASKIRDLQERLLKNEEEKKKKKKVRQSAVSFAEGMEG